jgi:hypothetical protein
MRIVSFFSTFFSPWVIFYWYCRYVQVTSPAGTTASALYQLEKGGFRTVVADAVWAAYRKALELGGQSSNVGPGRARS